MMEAHVFKHPFRFLSISLLLVGCAGQIRLDPLSVHHPASPQAPEAPRPTPSETLRKERGDSAKTDSPQSGIHDDEHSGHMTEKPYTCRMHPKVIRAKPGSCPECGMKLIEKEHLE